MQAGRATPCYMRNEGQFETQLVIFDGNNTVVANDRHISRSPGGIILGNEITERLSVEKRGEKYHGKLDINGKEHDITLDNVPESNLYVGMAAAL